MTDVLITGGSGFFGQAMVRELLTLDVERICVYSRDEHKQAAMREAILDPDLRLRWFIGDVRDQPRLRRAMEGVDLVIAAAALKRIETGAYDAGEMVKTNIGGAMNVIEAATCAGVQKVVALSTDKAYQPVSPYGQSKALAESLFLNANASRGKHGPIFSLVRYGNVWNSTGSVVPRWRATLASGATSVPVTDPECTRFFMRVQEAVALVVATAQAMKGGELIIPTLPAYRLGDLAEAMGAKMDVTGLPNYEKKHERMDHERRSEYARRMTVAELREEFARG